MLGRCAAEGGRMMQMQIPATDACHRGSRALLPLLLCPACGTPGRIYSAAGHSLECGQCGASFPAFVSGTASIPWVFTDPDATLLEWRARFKGFLQINSDEQARLKRALAESRLSKLSRRRIEGLLAAREVQRGQVAALLGPFGFDAAADSAQEPIRRLGSKVAKNQGLSSYQNNMFRDWCWNNGENEALLRAVEGVLKFDHRQQLGKVLTLGAGACRLPYDIHRNYVAELSVVLDINPLLLMLASRVIHGEKVALYEFPIAPLNSDSFAVQQNCRAPQSIEDFGQGRFEFVFGDAMDPPFSAGSFDTVLTPWLIDIIPQDLAEFIPRVNRLLSCEGVWLNTGSLAFFHDSEGWRYSEDELLQLIEENGFEILAARRDTVPYLQSPLSAHGRTESVLSFSARKTANVAMPPRYQYLPAWLTNTREPIPESATFLVASSNHLLQAQVLSCIDGERTIEEIGRLVARQYDLLTAEAVNAVQRILVDVYEAKAIHSP